MVHTNLVKQILLDFSDIFTEYRKDLSAVLLTEEKQLWLGSDETSTIERLDLVDGEKFANHRHFHVSKFIELPAPEEEEIDIEGLAYADEYLWFVGSHSYKRKKVKPDKSAAKNVSRLAKVVTEPNRYVLGRIPMVDGELYQSHPHTQNPNIKLSAAKLEITPQGNTLIDALKTDSHLGGFIQAAIPGKDNGLDIEGIAVYQDRIFLGLRGPVLRGWAVMLELELEEKTPGILQLKPIGVDGALYKKHFFNLKGLGIRDIYRDREDFIILAGPTMELDGPIKVYRQHNAVNLRDNILNEPQQILNLPHGYGNDRAEGITLSHVMTGVPSLLVVYDSPASDRLVGEAGILADIFDLP